MSESSRKVKNPLLSAAGQSFPFENFTGNTLLIPVTPATPAVLCDDNDPPKSEADSFLGQGPPTNPTPVRTATVLEEPEEAENQSQKPGYFTSILSSFPNLSLSTNKTPGYQEVQNPAEPSNFANVQSGSPAVYASGSYDLRIQGLQSQESLSANPSPAPQAPPPLTIPPSGGSTSYRLGNQRRLKYAPPPDLTSTPSKPYSTVSEPSFYQPSAVPPSQTYFLPTVPVQSPENSNPQTPSPAQSNSLQSSFRNSPIASPNPQNLQSPSYTYSPPQLIPGRAPEPATPQNTPANSNFPTFNAFRSTNQPSVENLSKRQPISAEKVTEKLEHLIAERNEDPVEKLGDELAEIDLTQTTAAEAPSVSNLFKDTTVSRKSDLNFPTTLNLEVNSQSGFVPYSYFDASQQEVLNPQFSGNNFFQSGQSTTFDLQTENFMVTAVPEPTGSATLNPTQMSVNPLSSRTTPDTVPPSLQNLAAGSSEKRMQYRPVYQHWFYRKEVESKTLWQPFSMQDSLKLEEIHNSNDISPETKVATDGGRYDVDILRRQRSPVYWTGVPNEVRRCSWFYKGNSDSRYVPYEESTATRLEEEYKQACTNNIWNRRIELNNGEYIVFHSSTIQVHYLTPSTPEMVTNWGASGGSEDSTYLQGSTGRPRVVKRGVDEFHIDDGEPEKVDHLLFLVHGIGSVCDLKFRSVEEVVDEFRSISLQLVQSHYRTAHEQGVVNKIEVLPISWHATLHSDDTGIDKKLKAITLDSIPKLRHFTNDTLLDILFYTSPIYCQTIMQTVGQELNRLFALFNERNPDFNGGIYLGGHSLGSLILFDLLCHQNPPAEAQVDQQEENKDDENNDSDNLGPIKLLAAPIMKRRLSRKVSYVMGHAGTGQPYIHYPQMNFQPRAFFALGSPIGMFVTVRGIDTLGENFALPTCPSFFNIFHPFDPVAYRVESLINPEARKYRPMLIPHHKGRKRMHLELKETMARVGADLKQKLLDSVRNTWNSVYQLAMFHKSDNQTLEQEIDKVVEEQLSSTPASLEQENDDGGADLKIGNLNGGRRIDYVLQEAPFEYINEYIFALSSHVCYWESEDTMLLILKEIYGSMGIQTDAQLPQQSLSIERPSTPSFLIPSTSANSVLSSPVLGGDPTAPISNKVVGPPPTSGFVRKSTS